VMIIQQAGVCKRFYLTQVVISRAYRIYSYNSTGNIKLYWESTNADATNNIKLYYCRNKSIPNKAIFEESYTWKLIDTITDLNLDSSGTFTSTSYKYIKVEFNNTDSTSTALLDRLYMVTDEAIEMIWESPYLELERPDLEKYIRKLHPDIETNGNIEIYYKTEKMIDWVKYEVAGTDKRVSTVCKHGQKIKYKIVSNNPLACRFKHMSIDYKERSLR